MLDDPTGSSNVLEAMASLGNLQGTLEMDGDDVPNRLPLGDEGLSGMDLQEAQQQTQAKPSAETDLRDEQVGAPGGVTGNNL